MALDGASAPTPHRKRQKSSHNPWSSLRKKLNLLAKIMPKVLDI